MGITYVIFNSTLAARFLHRSLSIAKGCEQAKLKLKNYQLRLHCKFMCGEVYALKPFFPAIHSFRLSSVDGKHFYLMFRVYQLAYLLSSSELNL